MRDKVNDITFTSGTALLVNYFVVIKPPCYNSVDNSIAYYSPIHDKQVKTGNYWTP